MTRGILIAGNESSLCRAIETEVSRRVEHFAAALIPNRFAGQARVPAEPVCFPLDWNPASPISARTLVLAAENRLGRVDEAILVCAPPPLRYSAAELPLGDIEIMINDQVKGWFFLVRELAALFRARQAGTLALVYSGGGKDDAGGDLMGPSALASFEALTRSLLASAFDERYLTLGCAGAGNETAFASFVVRLLDEGGRRANGKLHKYGKFNLFK